LGWDLGLVHHPGEGRGPIGKVGVTERSSSLSASPNWAGLRRGGAYAGLVLTQGRRMASVGRPRHFIAASMSLIGTNAKPTELSAIPYGMKIVSPCFNAPQL
jgi:hypothetical protein